LALTGRVRRSAAAGFAVATLLVALLTPGTVLGATTLTPVASGLSSPVLVTNAGDGSDRLFIVEQTGEIRVVKNGSLLPTPFLDLSGQISTGGERGLLGLAFHPSYETNGRFYVDFTRTNGDTVINEYKVSSGNPDVADPSTERRIITIGQPYANHNGGNIAFGRDGYFYIGMGDGGSGGDPGNRAQNLDSLLGKMLRIDVNGTSAGHGYRIPASNPWVGKPGRDEIWSRGLRNPWRWSFDRVNGTLWIGDVGQGRYEELDRGTPAQGYGRGANYGWRVLEGTECYLVRTGCSRTAKTPPVLQYSHAGGACAVTGGFAYHGTASPALAGDYVFGDFCNGRIYTVRAGNAKLAKSLLLDTNLNISSFGEDEAGEIYVVDLGGTVYRLNAT
jgi:glucose/arabinose dehydrogenase